MNAYRRFLVSMLADLALALALMALGALWSALQPSPDAPGWSAALVASLLLVWPLPVLLAVGYRGPRRRALSRGLSAPQNSEPFAPRAAQPGGRVEALVCQLRDLEDRRRAGALSEQEFLTARKMLLA